MKKLIRLMRREDSEKGVVAVIVALLLVGLLGFTALAIDESSWLVTQRKYQNAADAAALGAAAKRYKSNDSEKNATDYARQIISLNDLNLKDNEFDVQYDETKKTAKVVIKKPTNNYFSVALTGRDETMVSVSSTAGYSEITAEDATPFGVNSAIEAKKDLVWSGETGCNVTGDMVSGGKLTISNGLTVTKGGLQGDKGVLISAGKDINVDGNIFSGKTDSDSDYSLDISGTDIKIGGQIESDGNVKIESTGNTFGGSIKANGTLFMAGGGANSTKVKGNLLSDKTIHFNGPGNVISGNVLANGGITMQDQSGTSAPVVDGTFYQDGSLNNDQINAIKTSSGAAASVELKSKVDPFQKITHSNYDPDGTKWNNLKTYLTYDSSNADQPYTVITKEMVEKYQKAQVEAKNYDCWNEYYKLEDHWKDKASDAGVQYIDSDGSIQFTRGADADGFFKFCTDTANGGKGDEYPLYCKGSLYYNQGGICTVNHAIVVEKDFIANTVTSSTGKQFAIVSLNGEIKIEGGGTNTINGAMICLNNNGQIKMDNGGSVTGGVISRGTITMNGKWDCAVNTTWEQSIKPITTTTKRIVRLVN